MRRIALAMYLAAFAVSAGCDKKSEPPAPYSHVSSNPSPSSTPPPAPAPSGDTGSISGVVKLEGTLKPDGPISQMPNIPACVVHWGGKPPLGDTLILGDGQTMANVLVYVKGGLPARRYDPPTQEALFDQVGCVYTPHVLAVQANQPVTIRNSDVGIMHNVHGKPANNAEFNKGQANKGDQHTFKFPIPELAINVKCDVHPWMSAYLHVMGHPFFQVTGKDGAYTLSGLPPGEYEIHAWHERFKNKPLVAMVKVEAKGTARQDFTFQGEKK